MYSFRYRVPLYPPELTPAKLEVLAALAEPMREEMVDTLLAQEFHAQSYKSYIQYVPERKALSTDLNRYIREYPLEKSDVIAEYISTHMLLYQPHEWTSTTLDTEKWCALLAKEDQRDNLLVVLHELIERDFDFRGCMEHVDDRDLSARASFLVKMWRNETILDMKSFLDYREPADVLKFVFHGTVHLLWKGKFDFGFVELLNHVRFKPGSAGEAKARAEFQAASQELRAASREDLQESG